MKTLTTLLSFFLIYSMGYTQQKINIGIITDLQDARYLEIKNALKQELDKATGSTYEIRIDSANEVFCELNPSVAKEGYLRIMPTTDLVILLGSMSIHGVLQLEKLKKPVIGIGVFSNVFQGVPITESGTSGIPNFTYVKHSVDLLESVKSFQSLHHFTTLTVMVDKGFATVFNSNKQEEQVKKQLDSLGIQVKNVLVDKDIEKAISSIGNDAEAVLIAMPYQLNDSEFNRLITGINEKKIPSYSINQNDINRGALFSRGNKNDFQQTLRKIAITVDDILQGGRLESMSVLLNTPKDLYMNLSTAKAIEFQTTFKTILTANVVHSKNEPNKRVYSLEKVIKKALEENLSIKISYADLKYSELEVKQAKSQYFPGIDINPSFSIIDEPSAVVGRSEQTLTVTPSVSQIIYSESAIANIKIQKYLLEAQKYTTQQEIIDVVLDCYTVYLNVLRTKRQLHIQRKNLSTHTTNLELAKVRADYGEKDNADVYRFEGEVASAKQSVIGAQVDYNLSLLQLNNLLNNQLEDEFEVEDITFDDELLQRFKKSSLVRVIEGPLQLQEITKFLVSESQNNYPTSKELALNMKVVERQEKMNNRLLYLPTVSASGQISYYPYRGGAGSEVQPGIEILDQAWNVGLSVSYPIFKGNSRRLNLQQTRVQKNQLNHQITALNNNLELTVKSNVFNLLESSTDIEFSKISSKNQQQNFELIQQKYQSGLVTITQLLDAQNSYLNAQFNYANSVYNYLFAFLQLENSLGFHSQIATEEEKINFKNRFQQFISKTNE